MCIMLFINSFSGAVIKPIQNENKNIKNALILLWKIKWGSKKISKTKIPIPS